ncbi:serine/threonine-protein kinase [Acanthopleuribacter pedis]|uniref:Serine/threonine protein kinase n=1 Tax=Acanthopleuribacter pedis TaxID=442870 RepID=A0A8J7Q7N3_9BACT|nr:serine/threonine-protein kinase [Acanthopleuribacter pedis]MBO1319876.1 serine/threonine protein kinase [Acanthopleuribacter pedis]
MQGFQELQQQYDHLLQSDPDEQRRFLKELAKDHPKRAAKLMRMIGCQTDAVQFFNKRAEQRNNPSQRFLDHLLHKLQELQQPEQIGPYEIIEKLGSGGMGIVYKAAQKAPLERTVAVKLLRPNTNYTPEQTRHLLEQETSTLAKLKHPGIPQVFEIGVNENRSYLVMEHIEGRPIDQYCREQRVPLSQRIDLVLQICDTLLYCHGRGVIHGDLKPANVLVTAPEKPGRQPRVKVIDFGIARALTDNEDMAHLDFAFTSPRGSATFMAPEQATADSFADVRNDVYGLGAIFYQLLCGQPPLRPVEPDQYPFTCAEDLYAWLKQPLTRPSAVLTQTNNEDQLDLSPKRLKQVLRTELDALTAKATHPDPEQRLPNIMVFQNELHRFNSDQLLESAKPYGFGLRMKKLWRRDPFQLATYPLSALLFCSITLGWWFTAQARDVAVSSRDRTQFTQDILAEVLRNPHPMQSGPELLYIEQLIQTTPRVDRRVEGKPESAFELYKILGLSFYSSGYYSEAEKQFLKMSRAAEEWLGPESAGYAEAQLYLGKTEELQDRVGESYERLERALTLAQKTMSPDDIRRLEILVSLASVSLESGHPHRALKHAMRARQRLKRPFRGPENQREKWDRLHCQAWSLQGNAEVRLGRTKKGFVHMREAAACHEQNGDSEIFIADIYHRMTSALVGSEASPEHKAEAVEVGRKALAIRNELTPLHPNTAGLMYNLALALDAQGQKAEALEMGNKALKLMDELETVGKVHKSKDNLKEFLRQLDDGNLKDTIRQYEQEVEEKRKTGAVNTREFARTLSNLASYYNQNHQPREALNVLATSLSIYEALPGNHTKSRLYALLNQADAHNLLEQFDQAAAIMVPVTAEAPRVAGLPKVYRGIFHLTLGTALLGRKKHQQAAQELETAAQLIPKNHEKHREVLKQLIHVMTELGRDEAANSYRAQLTAFENEKKSPDSSGQ